MSKICAFFGHHDLPEDLDSLRERLHVAVLSAIVVYGVTEFWNGCYGGFDSLAAKMVVDLKEQFPQIRLRQVYAYPPCKNTLIKGFDNAFFPDALQTLSEKQHIPYRNIWMAEQADLIITYVNHAETRIHEPLDRACGRKTIINLGSYEPKRRKP